MAPRHSNAVREPAPPNERLVRALVALLVPLVRQDIQAEKQPLTDGKHSD